MNILGVDEQELNRQLFDVLRALVEIPSDECSGMVC